MHNVSLHFNPKYYCVLLTITTVKENKYVSLWKHKKFLSQPFWKKNDSGCDAFINSIQWVWASKSSFFLEFISKIFLNPLYSEVCTRTDIIHYSFFVSLSPFSPTRSWSLSLTRWFARLPSLISSLYSCVELASLRTTRRAAPLLAAAWWVRHWHIQRSL